MQTNFNIFRINCWLDDIDGNNFHNSIASLIYDYLYNQENKEILSQEIYQNITNNLSINLDEEYFNNLISKNKNLEKSPTDTDVLIKLTNEKYKEIDSNVINNSLEFHINKFLNYKGYEKELSERLIQLLANSLYENILVFSTENIKSILNNDCNNDFNQREIDVFNEFIDFDNHDKNNAIYSTFLKAVEFAILTSGRGVKNISKDIFKNKTYYIDTNIIIRLLGVNGYERQKAIEKLFDSCYHEGIKFEISFSTEKELREKIEERCEMLRKKSDLHSISVLEKLTSELSFNQDFETHYAKLRVSGKVKTINSYELFLKSNYQKIKDKYNFKGESLTSKLDNTKILELAESLYSAKNDDFSVRYTKTAAKVDAINVLYVKQLRGNNNYNYHDIRSFYLTTDRTLNKVLSLKNKNEIPETILPSQLFLIHNSLIEKDENDIKQFVKFIKKRTTEFKLYGAEAIKFVSEIRDITSDVNELCSILKAYSDTKYNSTYEEVTKFNKITTFNEFAKSKIDYELWEAKKGDAKYKEALEKSISGLKAKYRLTKILTYIIEFIFFVLIGFFGQVVSNNAVISIGTTIFLIIISVGADFLFKDTFGISSFLNRKIFMVFVTRSSFYKTFGNDDLYILKAKEIIVAI